MPKHQDLTGRSAVHPFAFVQGTDPALDPLNKVAAKKAWIDTTTNRLKLRDDTNTFWIDISAGTGVEFSLLGISYIQKIADEWPGESIGAGFPNPWVLVNYI